MKRIIITLISIASAIALVGVGFGFANASIPDSNGEIHACYTPPGSHESTLNIIDPATGSCGRGESAISWSTNGGTTQGTITQSGGTCTLSNATGPDANSLSVVQSGNDCNLSGLPNDATLTLSVSTDSSQGNYPTATNDGSGTWSLFAPAGGAMTFIFAPAS